MGISMAYTGEDVEHGLPACDSYLECGLPEFLRESVQAMARAWNMLDRGQEYLHWDCDYCSLQSDINSAKVNQLISAEQTWYLREKYLRMKKGDCNETNIDSRG